MGISQSEKKEIQSFSGSYKHLHISLSTIYGSPSVIDGLHHAVYKLKSEFLKTYGVVCSCQLDHTPGEIEQVGKCEALVSLGLVEGELKAFQALESKILQLENYVFKGTARIVSIIEGCIKIKSQ